MDNRSDKILNNLLDMASGNFEIQDYNVTNNDSIDAIGIGVMMLSEQLSATMASKDILNKALEEKNILLKEIHHRVKNNLQIVTSLLSLQVGYIKDDHVRHILQTSQHRINSMAMVHEMLYKSEDLSKIEYHDYLAQLIEFLTRSIKGIDNNIKFNLDIPKMYLNVNTAIPLGLLINEIITNALKYGIVDENEGKLSVSIQKDSSEKGYVMKIGDNGVGFQENFEMEECDSLGVQLMIRFTRQLKGSIVLDKGMRGANFIIRFQEI